MSLFGSCVKRQELKDYQPAVMKAENLTERRAQVEGLQESLNLQLKRLLEQEARNPDVEGGRACEGESAQKDARMANIEWIQAFDNALVRGIGHGLAFWLPQVRLGRLPLGARRYFVDMASGSEMLVRRSCVEERSGARRLESPQKIVDGRRAHPVLHMFSDLGSVGHPGANFLCRGLGLRCTLFFDLLHRVSCDIEDASNGAGLRMLDMEFTQVVKMRQGPWQPGGGHHGLLKGAAAEMFEHTSAASNVIFQALLEDLAEEVQTTAPVGSSEWEKEVWQGAKATLLSEYKGDNTKASRWWSYEVNSRALQSKVAQTKLNLIYLGSQKGWWKNYENCPLNQCDLGPPPADLVGDEVGAEAAEASAAAPSVAASSAATPSVAAPTARLSTNAARQAVRQKRETVSGTLHYACIKLCDCKDVRLWHGRVLLPHAVETAFNEWVTAFKTQEGTAEVIIQLAQKTQVDVFRKVFRTLLSPDFARSCGFVAGRRSARQIEEDKVVGATMFKFAVHMIGNIAMTNLMFQMPPAGFLALLSRDVPQATTLGQLKETWESLERLERTTQTNRKAEDFWKDLLWPLEQWAREVFVALSETDFQSVPDWVHQELTAYSHAHWSTLLIENLANRIRAHASKSPGKQFGPRSVWHACAYGGNTCAEHDRPLVKVTQIGRNVGGARVTTTTFAKTAGECSLSEDQLKPMTQRIATWPTKSASALKQCSVAHFLLRATRGDWNKIAVAWRSLLVTPGTLLRRASDKKVFLAVATTPFGFLGWRTSLQGTMNCAVMDFADEHIGDLHVLTVDDHTDTLPVGWSRPNIVH